MQDIVLGYNEENIQLSKVLRGRLSFARIVLDYFYRNGQPIIAALGILEQNLKGAVDIVAVGTGLQYYILCHRASPVSTAVSSQWQQVWRAVGGMEKSGPND